MVMMGMNVESQCRLWQKSSIFLTNVVFAKLAISGGGGWVGGGGFG